MRIGRMRIACCITKATHTLRICTTYCISKGTMVTRTPLDVTFIRTLPDLLNLAWNCCISICLLHDVSVLTS